MSLDFRVRPGVREDCMKISQLIKELATYEKMPDAPQIGRAELEMDGFGPDPWYQCFVAEIEYDNDRKEVVGYVLYFYKYTMDKGKAVYMEDLYVHPSYRRNGIGAALLKTVAQEGAKNKCEALDFAVLDWNEPSIAFYQKLGAENVTKTQGWQVMRFKREVLENMCF